MIRTDFVTFTNFSARAAAPRWPASSPSATMTTSLSAATARAKSTAPAHDGLPTASRPRPHIAAVSVGPSAM